MTFEEVIQPALDLVENGRPVDDQFYGLVSGDGVRNCSYNRCGVQSRWTGAHKIGEIFVQKDLAETFKRMIEAERNAGGDRHAGLRAARDLIYKGEIAREIADFYRAEGGLLTYEDLASFSVRVSSRRTHITYKGYDVYTCGPWCQGPTLNMALKIVEAI